MTRRDLLGTAAAAGLGALLAACTGERDRASAPETTAAGAAAPSSRPAETAPGPAGLEWRFPAEWEPHAACLMAWPWSRRIWGSWLDPIQDEVAGVARIVARFEPVLMAAAPGTAKQAQRRCGREVEVVEIPIDDFWTRDTGPVFVVDAGRSRLLGLDFVFNGWGGKYPPWENDDALPASVCEHLETPRRALQLVLEGGAVIGDGEGTLITTEECLLSPNRNPGLTQGQIEAALLDAFGAAKVVWLPHGLADDWITDGHVDGVAAFLAPARVLVQTTPGSRTPDEERLVRNREVLERATDARGRRFELVELPWYPTLRSQGELTSVSYVNFYLANGGVVVPTAGKPDDERALALLRDLFPDREIVGAPSRTLAFGGGGVHCITQQVPALGRPAHERPVAVGARP